MKKNSSNHYLTIKNKKHSYTITSTKSKKIVFFKCEAAKIAQEFLAEDIPALLIDLPELIIEEINYQKRQDLIRFRLSGEEKKIIEKKALSKGYRTISAFMRDLALGKI